MAGSTLDGTLAELHYACPGGVGVQLVRDGEGALVWYPAGLCPVTPLDGAGVDVEEDHFTPCYQGERLVAVIWRVTRDWG